MPTTFQPVALVRLGDAMMLVSSDGDRTILWLEGELDVSAASLLTNALADVRGQDVVVDLRGVTFIDSTVTYVLARSRDRLRSQGRDLTLQSPSKQAARVFTLCGTSWT